MWFGWITGTAQAKLLSAVYVIVETKRIFYSTGSETVGSFQGRRAPSFQSQQLRMCFELSGSLEHFHIDHNAPCLTPPQILYNHCLRFCLYLIVVK